MHYVNPIWLEGQRQRWQRHDWQRWLRHDAHLFAPPGSDASKSYAARLIEQRDAEEKEAAIAASDAEQETFEQEVLELRRDFAALKREYELRRIQQKYSPGQPRVPAGSPEGGQWTSGGGTGVAHDDSQDAGDGNPDDLSAEITFVAQNDATGRPIDLHEERQLGGHAIEGHVGKSQESLLARVRREALRVDKDGGFADGLRVGSFPSLEAANKLVNATVARNPGQVDLVTSGRSGREALDAYFDSPTGYEAYARTERSQTYIRDTYGVRVIIVPDGRAAKGYRIDTAYPMNFGR